MVRLYASASSRILKFHILIDLYGRGYSDAPHVSYTTELFTTQLASLMKHVGWDRAIITGLSMVCFLHLYIGFDLIIDL